VRCRKYVELSSQALESRDIAAADDQHGFGDEGEVWSS
jgi:hypothetical protein